MNSFSLIFLLALSAFAIDFDDIIPCSFELMTYTRVLSGGAELTTSMDSMYRDHDNLWRWDSEFKGMPGFFDGHEWSVIWRPDDGASYHDFTLEGKCLKNNGGSKMYPYPYEWLVSKTDGVTWTSENIMYNGEKAIKYSGKTSSKYYKFTATINLFMLKNTEDFVFGNGTVESSLVDVTFEISISKYVHNSPLPGNIFVPSAPCPATTVPNDASKDFQKFCYGSKRSSVVSEESSNGVVFNPSFLMILATLLAALIFVAV